MNLQLDAQYWELFYDQLCKDGWNLGWTSYVNTRNEEFWVVDGSQGDQHFAAEGKTQPEAFWQLNWLVEAKGN